GSVNLNEFFLFLQVSGSKYWLTNDLKKDLRAHFEIQHAQTAGKYKNQNWPFWLLRVHPNPPFVHVRFRLPHWTCGNYSPHGNLGNAAHCLWLGWPKIPLCLLIPLI